MTCTIVIMMKIVINIMQVTFFYVIDDAARTAKALRRQRRDYRLLIFFCN